MATSQTSNAQREIEAVLDWWREAGLAFDASDEPVSWLDAETKEPVPDVTEAPVPRPRPAPVEKPTGSARIRIAKASQAAFDPSQLPGELTEFASWWTQEKNPFASGHGPLIAPRGQRGAKVLFLVPQPEKEDRDTLLCGPRGRLLGSMVRAMGLEDRDSYLASALPAHTLQPDWDVLRQDGLGQLVRHHLALARPGRIVVLGRRILPLIAHEPTQSPADLQEFNHEGISLPMMAAPELGSLLRSAGQRKRFWQEWIEWTRPQ